VISSAQVILFFPLFCTSWYYRTVRRCWLCETGSQRNSCTWNH